MSMYVTLVNWQELIEQLKKTDDPQCFTVNYKPEEEKYALWIGNQPYSNYEEMLDAREQDIADLRTEKRMLQQQVAELQGKLESSTETTELAEAKEPSELGDLSVKQTDIIRNMIHHEMKQMISSLKFNVSIPPVDHETE